MPVTLKEQEGIVFAAFDAHAFDVAISEGNTEQTTDEQKSIDEGRETVEDDHVVEANLLFANLCEGEAKRNGKSQRREQGCDAFSSLGNEEVNEQENTCPNSEQDIGCEYFVIS